MKKSLLLLGLASVMLGFGGCTKDVAADDGAIAPEGGKKAPKKIVVSAVEDDTRMGFGDGKMSFIWEANDALAVFSTDAAAQFNNCVRYDLISGEGTALGEFELNGANVDHLLTPANLGQYPAVPTDPTVYVAVYPWKNFKMTNIGYPGGHRIGATVPNEQTYVQGGFDKLAMPMVAIAKTEDYQEGDVIPFKFKALGAMLHVKATSPKDTELKKIVITGNREGTNGLIPSFAGISYANFPKGGGYSGDAGSLSYEQVMDAFTNFSTPIGADVRYIGSAGTKAVTVKASAGTIAMTSSQGVETYVCVCPEQVSANGVNVDFYNADGSVIYKTVKSTSGAVFIKPSSVVNFPELSLATSYMPVVAANGTTMTFNAPPVVSELRFCSIDEDGNLTPIQETGDASTWIKMPIVIGGTTADVSTMFAKLAPVVDGKIIGHGKTGKLAVALYSPLESGTAVQSAPALFDYTVGEAPGITLTAISPAADEIRLTVGNYGMYSVFSFGIKEGENLVAADFEGVEFVTPTKFFGTQRFVELKGNTMYTLMVKYKNSNNEELSKFVSAKTMELVVKAPTFDGENVTVYSNKEIYFDGNEFPKGTNEFWTYYRPTAFYITWAPTGTPITADSKRFTIPQGPVRNDFYFEQIMGDDFVENKAFDFKVVLESATKSFEKSFSNISVQYQ